MTPHSHHELILASASPRRQELLREAGYPHFTVIPANVMEHEAEDAVPTELVLHNAALKAEYLSTQYPEKIILAADTTVAVEGRVLNKPADMEDARAMLRLLSGRAHSVYTGICLRSGARALTQCVQTKVVFKLLTEADITHYHTMTDPLDKAGGYGIQDGTEIIIDYYEGSFSNVMGLPIEETRHLLQQLGHFPSSEE